MLTDAGPILIWAWVTASICGLSAMPVGTGQSPGLPPGAPPGSQPSASGPHPGLNHACPAGAVGDIGLDGANAIAKRAARPGPVGRRLILERPGRVVAVTAHRAGDGTDSDFRGPGFGRLARYYRATIGGDFKLIPPFFRGHPSAGEPKCTLTLWICASNGHVVRLRAAPCPERAPVPQAHP